MRIFIKNTVAITCCSFTMMVLFFVFSNDDIAPTLNRINLWYIFLICLAASIAIQGVSHIELQNEWSQHILGYITIISCIFGLGTFILHLIPLTRIVVISIILFTLCIYAVCWYCFFLKNKSDANYINEQLQQKQKQKEKMNDKHH